MATFCYSELSVDRKITLKSAILKRFGEEMRLYNISLTQILFTGIYASPAESAYHHIDVARKAAKKAAVVTADIKSVERCLIAPCARRTMAVIDFIKFARHEKR